MIDYINPPNCPLSLQLTASIELKIHYIPSVNLRSNRDLEGMKKCKKPRCFCCSFVTEGTKLKSSHSKYTANISSISNCKSANIVFCITCSKHWWNQMLLKERFGQHIGYVKSSSFYSKLKIQWVPINMGIHRRY